MMNEGSQTTTVLVRFSVKVEGNPFSDSVFVSGNCKELGNWIHEDAIILSKEPSNDVDGSRQNEIWSSVVALPAKKTIQFRYFTGNYHDLPTGRRVLLVKHFESSLQARKITIPENSTTAQIISSDEQNPVAFGPVVQRGWLTSECEIHIRCLSNAIHWWKARHRTKAHSMKVVPMDLRYRENAQEDEDDLSSPYANDLEMAILKKDLCRFQQQPKYGRIFQPDDIVLYRMRVLEPNFMAYRCDFFAYEPGTEESAGVDGSEPRNVGCCYILPTNMKDTFGDRTVLINGLKHQPIGQLFVHYMLIQPTVALGCDLRISYAKYWRKRDMGYDIGHRGSGNSFSVKTQCAGVRENTIASLASAAENGADYVEFDVQLSKDKIPVIYHDFTVYITMRRRHGSGDSSSSASSVGSAGGEDMFSGELYEMPVKDLTLQQLHMLKLNHITEKDGQTKYNIVEDHQPFPSLEKALKVLDERVGFNVEVKFPLSYLDGKQEAEHFFERNEFVDIILRVVYQHAANRRIIFSCFDPDVCAMLRVKQNKYPVSYLSHGEVTLWPQYADPRTHTTRNVVHSAIAYDLLGINVHTQNLFANEWLMQEAKNAGLVLIVWGDDNNDANTIRHLKALGVDGIIYDRIEEFKPAKDNAFRLEYQAKRQLIDQLSRDSIIP